MRRRIISTALLFTTFLSLCSCGSAVTKSSDPSGSTHSDPINSQGQQTSEDVSADTFLPKDKEYSILFIGNSFTFYNDMPASLFAPICKEAGYNVKVDSITSGGYFLHQFASLGDKYGKEVDRLLHETKYDYVILQEQSGNAVSSPSSFFGGVRSLARKIKASGCENIILFETWGYKKGYHLLPTHGGDTATMEEKMRASYTAIAEETDSEVALVGVAFRDIYENTDINLYDSDLYHPSEKGSMLAAYTIFSKIFNYDVRDMTFRKRISKDEMKLLKAAAYNAVFEDHPVDDEYKINSKAE